jgi:hypothetical protein
MAKYRSIYIKGKDMFQELWSQIDVANDSKLPKVIASIAEQYDEIVLSYSNIPDEEIDFLAEFFSCERVLQAREIEHFLLEINVDLCKYTEKQRMKLLKTLIENAGAVTDQLGRHSVGDFIARAYPSDLTYTTFLALPIRTPSEKHVAFVGLDVLRMRESKESNLYKKIEKKWRELMNSEVN